MSIGGVLHPRKENNMSTLVTPEEEELVLRLERSQPQTAGELVALMNRMGRRIVEAVLAEEAVRERLAGCRWRVLTVDHRVDKADGNLVPPRLAEVGIYDYDRDVLVVAAVDLRAGTLVQLFERDGSAPPITPDELEDAGLLLQEVPKVARALRVDGAAVTAFPTPSYAFEGERQRHRGCTVYAQTEPHQVAVATVDLSARELVPDDQLHVSLRAGGPADDISQGG
jgi:hypothetical protein